MLETDKGRRVELIQTDDPHTELKPGARGTYQFRLKQRPPMEDQHVIKWDEGSSLILLEGVDKFKFIPCDIKRGFWQHDRIYSWTKEQLQEELGVPDEDLEEVWGDGDRLPMCDYCIQDYDCELCEDKCPDERDKDEVRT